MGYKRQIISSGGIGSKLPLTFKNGQLETSESFEPMQGVMMRIGLKRPFETLTTFLIPKLKSELKKVKLIAAMLFSAAVIFFANQAWSAQLTSGTYFGSVQMEGSHEQIAVSLDAYNTQINDPTVFPKLNVTIRLNLGGYVSSEYVAYHFYSPEFNFEQNVLQLDDPAAELTGTLTVTNTDSETIIEGPVVYRPTQTKGILSVVMEIDGFDAEAVAEASASTPFLLTLEGEYRGRCGTREADLQIETGRGLGTDQPDNALANYMITGRLGYADKNICGIDPQNKSAPSYCQIFHFSSGAYSFFDGHLNLQGPVGAIDCTRSGDSLSCNLGGVGRTETCSLKKAISIASPPLQAASQFYIKVPPEQMKILSDPLPPQNTDLIADLNGDFFGFLHYENQDKFQMMALDVVASTSTENPHIQNQVMIAPTVSMAFGSSWTQSAPYSIRFSQRVFYLNPGFALQGPSSDDFLVIQDWRRGYVRGVWYSRSYGRVGTFELQKGSKPVADPKMQFVGEIDGQYLGPKDGPMIMRNQWWFQLRAPGQVVRSAQSGVSLLGQFRLAGNFTQSFSPSNFDLYTGTFNLLAHKQEGDRILSGRHLANGSLSILWPVGPAFESPMANYDFYTYERANGISKGAPNGR